MTHWMKIGQMHDYSLVTELTKDDVQSIKDPMGKTGWSTKNADRRAGMKYQIKETLIMVSKDGWHPERSGILTDQ